MQGLFLCIISEDGIINFMYRNSASSRRKGEMSAIDEVKWIEFNQIGDTRGYLVAVEGGDIAPFNIKRVFYIYGSERKIVRGRHANRNSQFVMISVVGTSKVRVDDGKGGQKVFELTKPHRGLYLPSMIWKDMYDFSDNSVLLVLASEHYDPKEYIRDYDKFCEEVKGI